jgi:glycerol-3-phosphate acyltransferase PlsY
VIINYFIISAVSYLIGSVPFGWFLAKYKNIDVLAEGSGKIGFTNILRLFGLRYAIPILILDASKGAIVILIAQSILNSNDTKGNLLALIFVMIGHSWSIFLFLFSGKLLGGRSVAIGIGALLILAPTVLAVGLFFVVLITLLSRYMSLGTLIGITIGCLYAGYLSVYKETLSSGIFVVIIIGTLFIYVRHIENIKRLMNGTERKISIGGKNGTDKNR